MKPWNDSEADPIEDLENMWQLLSEAEYTPPELEIWKP